MHLQQSVRRNGLRDPMTGLYSRGYLLETSWRELHRAQREDNNLALVMFDIDRFGPFNDHHGPENGDLMLQSIADYLLRHFRQSDVASRYSGERFVVLLPDAGANASLERASRLREAIGDIRVNGGHITISGAVAAYPEHGDRVEDLIHAAETGIINARQRGGDRVQLASVD
jgi:diguanylate cyclase (GGDEF)-like protein